MAETNQYLGLGSGSGSDLPEETGSAAHVRRQGVAQLAGEIAEPVNHKTPGWRSGRVAESLSGTSPSSHRIWTVEGLAVRPPTMALGLPYQDLPLLLSISLLVLGLLRRTKSSFSPSPHILK